MLQLTRGFDNATLEASLHDLAQRVLKESSPAYDEWLYRYCGELAEPSDAARYLRYQLDHLRLARTDPAGKSVLDAGCGFGFALLTYALLGAERLCGIDSYQGMVDTIHAYAPVLPEEIRSRLEVTLGDVVDMPYGDGEFDIVLSIEAISHYLDVDAFIAEAARVLKPGGILIVSDGNNGLNPSIRRSTREIWSAFENGSGADVHGHHVVRSYVDKRRDIIRARFPELDAGQVDKLASATSGLVEEQVVEATRRYLDTGEEPSAVYEPGQLAVSPDGQVIERLFDPFELATKLDASGFRSKVHGYWGGAGGNPILRAANRVLDAASRVTIYSARGFRLVAVKESGGPAVRGEG